MNGRFVSLTIETPEGVAFQHVLASPVSRCLALMVDFGVVSGLLIIVSLVIQLLNFVSIDIATAVYSILYFLISIGYFLVLEYLWKGQTMGKRVMRLRVMDGQGYRLGLDQIVMRNLMRFVDSLPFFYFVAGVASVLNRRSQRLGDIVAGTVVVRMPEAALRRFSESVERRHNSFRDYPRLEAQLRERVNPEQANLALQALLRRDTLDSDARIELFTEMASYFKTLAVFPGDLAEMLTDEQYVRNCVDSVFRTMR